MPAPPPSRPPGSDDLPGAGADAAHDRYLAAVAAVYQTLDAHFDALLARCETPVERQRLTDLLQGARDAYWRAVASSLGANNQLVREIYDDLVRATRELKELLANLQRVAAAIELLTQTVRLAASLVMLAAL